MGNQVLVCAPSWAIRTFRPFGPVPVLPPLLSDYVKVLDFTQHISASDYCLDAWLRANRKWLDGCAIPDGPRITYQPLQIRDRGNDYDVHEVPDDAYFARLLSDHNGRASIIGEGGVGKTAFATALLKSVNKRSIAQREMLGLFLPSRSIYSFSSFESIINAIQQRISAELRKRPPTWFSIGKKIETQDVQLIKTLLSKGKIVLVLDDLPRYIDETWELPAHQQFNQLFPNFFYTGRNAVINLGRTIEPRPIDSVTLLTFVGNYVANCSGAPLTEPERADLNDGIHALFGARGVDAKVPALFGRLVGDAILVWRERGTSVADRLLTVPNLIMEFLQRKFEALEPQELSGISPDGYWRVAGCLAWLCLGKNLMVSSQADAADALKLYGDGDGIVRSLCLSDIAHKTVNDRIVIGSDALAEYLAALWIFEASIPKRWEETRNTIEEALEDSRAQSFLSSNARSFLSALLDVAENSSGDGRYGLPQTSASSAAMRTIAGWLAIGDRAAGEIVVGILHSQTGHMAT